MWPFKRREDQLIKLLTKMTEQQAENQRAFLDTTNRFAEAAKQQGEVLSKYLDLFKTPAEPRRWTGQQTADQEMKEALKREGYPVDGTEEEQAKWLAENL